MGEPTRPTAPRAPEGRARAPGARVTPGVAARAASGGAGAAGSGGETGGGGASVGGSGGGSSGAAGSEKLLDAIDITSFALDSAYVYFTATDPDAFPATGYGVFRVAKTGGAAQPLVKHEIRTHAVSVDAAHAYYVTHDTTAETTMLNRVPLGGGASETLDTLPFTPIEGPGVESVATDEWVYWAGTSELRRVQKKNGAGQSLGGGGRDALAVDATHVYSLFSGGFEPSGSVWRTPLGTGQYEPIAETLPRPTDMAIDDTSVYLVMLGQTVQTTDGSLVAIPKSGGAKTTLVADVESMLAIAVDATDVYFGAGDATIRRVSKSGGAVQVIAQAATLARGLALDSTHAYWHGQSSIHRAPR